MADDPDGGLTVTKEGIWLKTSKKDSKGRTRASKSALVIRYENVQGGGLRKVLTEAGADYITEQASEGAVLEEIADCMGIHRNTFSAPHNKERAQTAYRKGVALCNRSLREKQVELAMKGNPKMLEWLGRVRLGQKDTDTAASSELAEFVKALGAVDADPEEE